MADLVTKKVLARSDNTAINKMWQPDQSLDQDCRQLILMMVYKHLTCLAAWGSAAGNFYIPLHDYECWQEESVESFAYMQYDTYTYQASACTHSLWQWNMVRLMQDLVICLVDVARIC